MVAALYPLESSCTILLSHQQYVAVPGALHAHQHLVLSLAILTGISMQVYFTFSWWQLKMNKPSDVLSGQSYLFFCEVSYQIFCPFFIELLLFIIELKKCFTYSGNIFCHRYVLRWFLLACGLPFNLVNNLFWLLKHFFILMKSNLLILFLLEPMLFLFSQKSFQLSGQESFVWLLMKAV